MQLVEVDVEAHHVRVQLVQKRDECNRLATIIEGQLRELRAQSKRLTAELAHHPSQGRAGRTASRR